MAGAADGTSLNQHVRGVGDSGHIAADEAPEDAVLHPHLVAAINVEGHASRAVFHLTVGDGYVRGVTHQHPPTVTRLGLDIQPLHLNVAASLDMHRVGVVATADEPGRPAGVCLQGYGLICRAICLWLPLPGVVSWHEDDGVAGFEVLRRLFKRLPGCVGRSGGGVVTIRGNIQVRTRGYGDESKKHQKSYGENASHGFTSPPDEARTPLNAILLCLSRPHTGLLVLHSFGCLCRGFAHRLVGVIGGH